MLAVPLDLHPQDERCWAHVRHLEALLQLLLNHRHGFGVVAGQKKVINIAGQVDPDTVVVVQVDARVGLERDEPDLNKDGVNGVKPVPRALDQPLEALL